MDLKSYQVVMGGIVIAIAAIMAALGAAIVIRKYFEGASRQPEVKEYLFGRLMVLLPLIEALPLIALVFGYLLISGRV